MVVAQTNPPNLDSEVAKTHFTPDEYREIEETAAERHEYCNGEIIVMPGGSEVHSRITVNITAYLHLALRDTNYQTYNSDLRIWIPDFNHGTYADVLIIDGEPEFHDNRTDEIINPSLIIEVLSPSTQSYDRGDKFRKYRSLASFREYVLVSQTEPYIEHYHKQEDPNHHRWQLQVYDQIDQAISLQTLNVEISLPEIYRRIKF